MTQIRDTSLEAYESIKKSLADRQRFVFAFFEENKGKAYCDRYVAEILKLSINRVTGRRNELVDKGLLVLAGKEKRYGRRVCVWRAVLKPQKQETLFD